MAKTEILWMFLEMAQRNVLNKVCPPALISVDRIQVACEGSELKVPEVGPVYAAVNLESP